MKRHLIAESQDRRGAQRYPIVLPIAWEKGTGMTCNVSATGAFFKTESYLSVGASITFFLRKEQQPQQSTPLYFYVRGKVVRIEPYEGQWGIGLQFTSFRRDQLHSPFHQQFEVDMRQVHFYRPPH
jgi:hypothetical protein